MDSSLSLLDVIEIWARLFLENQQYLLELDGVAGDGDLGIVLSDGFEAVKEAISHDSDLEIADQVRLIGDVLGKHAPSTIGTLLSVGFKYAARALKGIQRMDLQAVYIMMQALAEGIMEIGGAKEGEKTILDALCPGVRALQENREDPMDVTLAFATEAARKGFIEARGMIALHGRIAIRGTNSIGIADPGAAAAVILFEGLEEGYLLGKAGKVD